MTKSCIFVPIATDRFMFKLTYQKEQNKTFKKKDLRIFYIYVIIIKISRFNCKTSFERKKKLKPEANSFLNITLQ